MNCVSGIRKRTIHKMADGIISDRDASRRFFIEVWGKHLQGLPLQPLEKLLLDIIQEHPEYHNLYLSNGLSNHHWQDNSDWNSYYCVASILFSIQLFSTHQMATFSLF